MTTPVPETRSVVVERTFPYPPARLWRALTQPHMMAEWLMKTDFAPEVGRDFTLTGDWGAVDCTVIEIEQERTLSYTWRAMGLDSVVTFSLRPDGSGTHLRMEQAGFLPDQEQSYRGAIYGWAKMIDALETVVAKKD